jgi:RNA polymerase sigma-70 factor, ECF subfamily
VRTRRSNASLANTPLALVVGGRPAHVSDANLARGLAAGEAWAIAETWRRFAPMVLAMAERAFGSRVEADDISQDVFYHLFRKAKTLREPDSLRSFVYSFAVRIVKSELRRRKVRGWFPFLRAEVPVETGVRPVDLESRDLLNKLYALLDRLTPRDRLVFVLRRMESKTVEEIARSLDISTSTVKRSMAHASSRLSRWIDADPGLAGLARSGGAGSDGWGS